MSKESNVATAMLVGEIGAARDWERFGEVYADDFVDHDGAAGQPAGLPGMKWFWRHFAAAFPDFEPALDVVPADDEYVTLVYRLSGTHAGEWEGHAPTGRRFEIRALQTSRFADGKVVERWGSCDMLGMYQQLGLVASA